MFVGHGLLAFAIVATLAARLGARRERALAIGVLAAGFATVPDVDILHPLLALLVDPVPATDAPSAFWALSTEVHRTATHSLVVGLVTAVGVSAWAARRGTFGEGLSPVAGWQVGVFGIAVLGGLVTGVALLGGPLAAAIVGLMAAAALGLTALASRASLGPEAVGLAAVVGLVSHPFGDLLTGQPPPLFYPFGVEVLSARVTLHPDPVLHLLGAFLVELATAWLALLVLARLSSVRLRPAVGLRAGAGLGYAGAVLVLPPPSLDAATPFVVSVLAVGLVGATFRPARGDVRWRTATTALAAVTLATLAYGAAYVAL